MKLSKTILASTAVTALALLGAAGMQGAFDRQAIDTGQLPQQPAVAIGVNGVLFAQPFLLEESYTHQWRAEQPSVNAGYLLVLEVDEAFTVPRNTLESVLYVGEQTAERINWGTGSGRIVAVLPTPIGADGMPQLDFSTALAWYGSPELPERVDAARIAAELADARTAGLTPLDPAGVALALEEGGELLTLADKTALERYAAEELLLTYSPSEAELAESLLSPLLR